MNEIAENIPATLEETESHPVPSRSAAQAQITPFSSSAAFADAQRMAKALAASTLVPNDYRGNIANCVLALEMAARTGSGIMAVMQDLVIVHGKPAWQAKYIIGALNSCGRFEPLQYEQDNAPDPLPDKWQDFPLAWRCRATARDKKSGELRKGPWVSIATAHAEGWIKKNGSKWQSMPELMLMYRSASFFGKLYAPEILLGMASAEEAHDIVDVNPSTGEVVNIYHGRPAATSRTEQVAGILEKAVQSEIGDDSGQEDYFPAPGVADVLKAVTGSTSEDDLAECEDVARNIKSAADRNTIRAAIEKRREELSTD